MTSPNRRPKNPALSWKLFVPLGLSVLGLCCLKLLDPHLVSREQLLGYLRPLGPWAPLAFVGLLAVRPLVLLPGQLLTALGGVLFGGAKGTLLAVAGSALGSTLIFVLSRRFGGKLLRRGLGPTRAEALSRAARNNDFLFALLFTLNPLVPTDPILAIAASTGARYSRTLAGTLLGIIPGTLATAYFGMALSKGNPWVVALTVAGWVVSVVGGIWVGYRMYMEVLAAEEQVKSEAGKPSRRRRRSRRARMAGQPRHLAAPPAPPPPA